MIWELPAIQSASGKCPSVFSYSRCIKIATTVACQKQLVCVNSSIYVKRSKAFVKDLSNKQHCCFFRYQRLGVVVHAGYGYISSVVGAMRCCKAALHAKKSDAADKAESTCEVLQLAYDAALREHVIQKVSRGLIGHTAMKKSTSSLLSSLDSQHCS